MGDPFLTYRTIPIGTLIRKALKERHLSQRCLALSTGLSYGHVNGIVNNNRKAGQISASKIEKCLCISSGLLLKIQKFQLQREAELKHIIMEGAKPSIRRYVFWDINFDKLDWQKNKVFIIKRVEQYGTEEEKDAVARFYQFNTRSQVQGS